MINCSMQYFTVRSTQHQHLDISADRDFGRSRRALILLSGSKPGTNGEVLLSDYHRHNKKPVLHWRQQDDF